jgi:mono/diheme cytochrome c family protein
MMAWENMLNEKQIEQVADYMLSLKKSKKQKS